MKKHIFTLILAAGCITAPAYAQYETRLTPVDPATGHAVRVEESRTTMPSGRTVIERRVVESEPGYSYGSEQYGRYGRYEHTHSAPSRDVHTQVQTTVKSTPTLMYDGISEPLYLEDSAIETRSVTYHFE